MLLSCAVYAARRNPELVPERPIYDLPPYVTPEVPIEIRAAPPAPPARREALPQQREPIGTPTPPSVAAPSAPPLGIVPEPASTQPLAPGTEFGSRTDPGTPGAPATVEPQPAGGQTGLVADESPVEIAVVEKQPRLENMREVQRTLQRLYPGVLRDAGVSGTTTLEFVIGEDGRVEEGSIQVVSATDSLFGAAAREALRRMRFTPGRVNGRTVRVRTSMPIQWQLEGR